jgi:predicted CoA-binding protein
MQDKDMQENLKTERNELIKILNESRKIASNDPHQYRVKRRTYITNQGYQKIIPMIPKISEILHDKGYFDFQQQQGINIEDIDWSEVEPQ